MSLQAVIVHGEIYSFQSEIKKQILVPKHYHTQQKESSKDGKSHDLIEELSGSGTVISSKSMQMHTNLLCIVEKDQHLCFLVLPSLTSRQKEIVPRQHLEDIRDMRFVSNDVVLVWDKDDKVVHFHSDGTVLHQADDEVSKLFKNKVFINAESEIINDTKYIVFNDYINRKYSVLLYDEAGNAQIIGQVNMDKIFEKIRLAIKWNLYKMASLSSNSNQKSNGTEDEKDKDQNTEQESLGDESDPEYGERQAILELGIADKDKLKTKAKRIYDTIRYCADEIRTEGEYVRFFAYYDPNKKEEEQEKKDKEETLRKNLKFEVYKVKNEAVD